MNTKTWKSCFCLFTDGKQHESREVDNYPWKSCSAAIQDVITRDLDMITRDLDMIIV